MVEILVFLGRVPSLTSQNKVTPVSTAEGRVKKQKGVVARIRGRSWKKM